MSKKKKKNKRKNVQPKEIITLEEVEKFIEANKKTRVKKNEELYQEEKLTQTMQQQFHFEEVDDTFEKNSEEVEPKNLENQKDKENINELDTFVENTTEDDKGHSTDKDEEALFVEHDFSLVRKILLGLLICTLIGTNIYTVYMYCCHPKKVKVVKEVVKLSPNYLFLGDSITDFYDLNKYYENMPVVNSGISGNTTDDILNDMQNRAYRYNPSKVFLLIGTNDLLKERSASEIAENVQKIIENIQENRPLATIYVESVYPVNKNILPKMVSVRTNENIKKITEELKKYCEEKALTYINMYDLLIDEEGNFNKEYTDDGLHPNDNGYEVITEELKKYIK